MKDLNLLKKYRVFTRRDVDGSILSGENYLKKNGAFDFPGEKGVYRVAVAEHFGWQHVTMVVSTVYNGEEVTRIPGTSELAHVKELIFGDEPVIEVHPKKEDYVNINPYMLHLWRPANAPLVLPPKPVEFTEQDIVSVPNSDVDLLVSTSRANGWECYEVSVLKDGNRVRRKPSWDEMCVAKRAICGEDSVALQYHIKNDGTGAYSIRLWVPPKTLDLPLPEPYMVGRRDEKDEIKYVLHTIMDAIDKNDWRRF